MHYVIMNFSVVYPWNIFISFLAQTFRHRSTRRIVFYTIPCLRYRVIVNQTAWRSALRTSIIKPDTLRRELGLTPQRVFDRGKIIYSRATIFNVLNNELFRVCAFIDVFHHSPVHWSAWQSISYNTPWSIFLITILLQNTCEICLMQFLAERCAKIFLINFFVFLSVKLTMV